jgi:hypothetical protein
MSMAKANLTRDGHLSPVAILFRSSDGQMGVVSLMFDSNSKYPIMMGLGDLCKKQGFDEIIMVNDCAVRIPKSVEEAKFIAENYETESPSCYPESMRKECIVLHYHSFKTNITESLVEIYTNKDGAPVFENPLPDMDGHMESNILNTVIEGYEKGAPDGIYCVGGQT